MTTKGHTDDLEAFTVGPAPVDPSELVRIARRITESLKKSELRQRKRESESELAFAVRIALHAQAIHAPLFRKRNDADSGRITAWLGIVKQKADEAALRSRALYTSTFRIPDVRSIAMLSADPDCLRTIQDVLREKHQIILVYERSFTSMKLDGCTFRLASGHPVVAMSLRYARYDHFWFTLLHELSHVAMHYEALDEPIFEDLDASSTSPMEKEANRLAADSVIPPEHARRLFREGAPPQQEQLVALGRALEIHPAIIAGAYRHRMKTHTVYTELVNAIDVRKTLGI